MKSLSSPRRLAASLLLCAAALGTTNLASAADLSKRLKVKQDLTEIIMGQIMHDFYMGKGFNSLNGILTAKASGALPEDVTDVEILLGDLYSVFGMPEAADNVYSRIITRDMRSDIRSETWFRQGRLKYRQGNYFEAERILNVPVSATEITPQEAERRVMLANILMSKNEFDRARELLAPIPKDTALGMYATYNMGVAHIRANQAAEGIQLLESVRALPVSDDETNALKDRAALAIGYSHLQAKDHDKARDALVNVRLSGPFSNSAMLALGYAHYLRNDHKRALSFWLELMTRNAADSSVQEAMMLAPHAYEALNANQQAFYGYKLAAQNMGEQLEALEKTAANVRRPDWLDKLTPAATTAMNSDPLMLQDMALPSNPTETAFLSSLFASHTFNETYLQYQQLRRAQGFLAKRRDDLRALQSVSAELARRQPALANQEARVSDLERKSARLNEYWPSLQSKVRSAARNARNVADTMNAQDRQRLGRIEALEMAVRRLPEGTSKDALGNRIRALKGLHGFNIVTRAPRSQNQLLAELGQYEGEIAQLRKRTEALRQLLEDNKNTSRAATPDRIQTHEGRIGALEKKLDAAIAEHRTYLSELAAAALDDKRNQISDDLAETHLNIARLQDAALIRDNRPVGKAARTQP